MRERSERHMRCGAALPGLPGSYEGPSSQEGRPFTFMNLWQRRTVARMCFLQLGTPQGKATTTHLEAMRVRVVDVVGLVFGDRLLCVHVLVNVYFFTA